MGVVCWVTVAIDYCGWFFSPFIHCSTKPKMDRKQEESACLSPPMLFCPSPLPSRCSQTVWDPKVIPNGELIGKRAQLRWRQSNGGVMAERGIKAPDLSVQLLVRLQDRSRVVRFHWLNAALSPLAIPHSQG